MAESGSTRNSDKAPPSGSPSPAEKRTARKAGHILIVEDNPADVFLIREAIETAHIDAELHIVNDGQRAIRFLDEADGSEGAPCPAIVILDINLPKKNGGEVLDHLRKSRRCCRTPVLVISTSDAAEEREKMHNLGSSAYFRKPSEYADFMKLGEIVSELIDRRPS